MIKAALARLGARLRGGAGDGFADGPGDEGRGRPAPAPIRASAARSEVGHAAGALFGLAVGDALGTTLEFRRIDAPGFARLLDGPHRDILGQGPFALLPGQVTDDTQMALCLFHSLLAGERLDPVELAGRYLAWRDDAFDVGAQTGAALDQLAANVPPLAAGRAVWDQRGRRPAGNGALMRTAPIGALLAADPALRREASLRDAALTHADPRCLLASTGFNAAIARAVMRRSGELPAAALAAAAAAEIDDAGAALAGEMPELDDVVAAAVQALHEDLRLARTEDPWLYGPELHLTDQQGFVRVAFRLAFWELLHAPSFEAALLDVVNRGGDADTNGAITGALVGAYHGIDAIPDRWLHRVGLVRPESASGALSGALHPLRFHEGLERIYASAS